MGSYLAVPLAAMDPDEPQYEDDVEYEDDAVDEDIEQWEEELDAEQKPEPMSFADEYSPAAAKPVELVVPGHAEAFQVIPLARERRFPAKRVAHSAAALANALRARAAAKKAS